MKTEERVEKAFGKAVRTFRLSQSISQERLAALAGLHRTYIGDVERGERNISIVNMARIAKALGVTLSRIVLEMERHRGARSAKTDQGPA